MCGRAVLGEKSWPEFFEWLNLVNIPDDPIVAGYNIAPTSICPIVIEDAGGWVGRNARWGLVPEWHSGTMKALRYNTFNARAEEAHTKPAYRDALKRNHCLFPLVGYYEWSQISGSKMPYYIHFDTNAPATCLAGIYTQINLPDYSGFSFSILTEAATGSMAELHHRIPVILDQSSYADWLACTASIDQLQRLDRNRIKYHMVDAAVGNVRNNYPELIDKLDKDENK